MIPWYKRFYQVGKEEFGSELSATLIIGRLSSHFDCAYTGFSPFTGEARNPYTFKLKGKRNFEIRETNRWKGGKNPPEMGVTVIHGSVRDFGDLRKVEIVATIPLMWIIAGVISILIASGVNNLILFIAILFHLCLILWLRHVARKDLRNVDIEIYKSLKAK